MEQKRTVPMSQQDTNDEIDLFELWEGLVQEKFIILISFFVVVILAAVYAFFATPVYQSSVFVQPPKKQEMIWMNGLNQIIPNSTVYTSDSVFQAFQVQLKSRRTLKQVFDENNLDVVYVPNIKSLIAAERLVAKNKAFEQFFLSFSVQSVDKDNHALGVSAQFFAPLTGDKVIHVLNSIVMQAEINTVNYLVEQIQSEIKGRQNLIQKKITGAKQIEPQRRLDQIVRLEEAILVTKQLGIIKPLFSGGYVLELNNIETAIGHKNLAFYLLGSELLEAEKKVLENRTNSEAFIDKFRDWQETLLLLKSLKIEPEKFGVVQVDQAADFSEKVKPKKALILAVGGVLGLMLGVFIALIRRAVKNRKALQLSSI